MKDRVHFVVECREIVIEAVRREKYSINDSFTNEVHSAVVIIE